MNNIGAEADHDQGIEGDNQAEVDSTNSQSEVEDVTTKTQFSGIARKNVGLFDTTTQVIDIDVCDTMVILSLESIIYLLL